MFPLYGKMFRGAEKGFVSGEKQVSIVWKRVLSGMKDEF
jgi:hypothetical protein